MEQRRGRRGSRVDSDVMPRHAMRNTIEKRGLDENCAAHDREVEKPGLVYVTSGQGHVRKTVSRKVSDLCVCGNPADSIAGAWARDSHASLKWGRSMQRKNGGQRGQTSSDGRKRQTSGYGLREGRELDITRSSEAWRGGGGRWRLGYRKMSPTIGCTRCLQDPSREAKAHSMVLESSDPQ